MKNVLLSSNKVHLWARACIVLIKLRLLKVERLENKNKTTERQYLENGDAILS